MIAVTKFRSFDGVEFDEKQDCLAHEKRHAHLRLCGLTVDAIEAALTGDNPELADAIEVVGSRIAVARRASGKLKRPPNGEVVHARNAAPAPDEDENGASIEADFPAEEESAI